MRKILDKWFDLFFNMHVYNGIMSDVSEWKLFRARNCQWEGNYHEYERHVSKVWPTAYPRVWMGLHVVHERKTVSHCYYLFCVDHLLESSTKF
jgi:hypothetical protein